MPTAVDSLTPQSSEQEMDKAVSSCISTEVSRGRDQQQAIAMCISQANAKTGKSNARANSRFPTMPSPG